MTACTERAVFVQDSAADAPAKAESHDRLYFGSETCETLIPDRQRLSRLLQISAEHKCAITVATPACTNEGLARVERLVGLLPVGTEVVFNDWGVFGLLRSSGCRPVLGRLLVRVSRGFRRAGMASFPPELMGFLRHSNLDNREFQEFLLDHTVHRVELDNVAQGFSFRMDATIRASLYVPFVYLASGRKCVHARLDGGTDPYRSDVSCRRGCRKRVLWGQVWESDEWILMSRNAHFYENATLPPELQAWNVDRLVDCAMLGEPVC
jgi:hypothetical protein